MSRPYVRRPSGSVRANKSQVEAPAPAVAGPRGAGPVVTRWTRPLNSGLADLFRSPDTQRTFVS